MPKISQNHPELSARSNKDGYLKHQLFQLPAAFVDTPKIIRNT
jgi:hypothetical protein